MHNIGKNNVAITLKTLVESFAAMQCNKVVTIAVADHFYSE